MATSKQLREQLSQVKEQFQSDIDASVVYHPDNPKPFGSSWMIWSVTMPVEEYQARQQAICDLQLEIHQVQEAEQTELALDLFLHEPE